MFLYKAIKSPIEIRFQNNKTGTGILHSIEPTSFDFVVSGYTTHGEKEKVNYKSICFAEITGFTVFPSK